MHALRFPLAAGFGLLAALALFTLLCTFIGRTIPVDRVARSNDVRYTRPIVEPRPPAVPRQEILHPPQLPLVAVPGIRGVDRNAVPPVFTGARTFLYEPYALTLDLGHDRPALGEDRDVIPLVRAPPEYPPGANTEGWVKVQYTITAAGTVRDPFVVDASPKGVFDSAALKAIARWRYSPKIDGGVAVERVGLQTLIRFELQ